MNNPLMCENPELAKLNRARVKEGFGNSFYNGQRRIAQGWVVGQPKPENLIVGDLPTTYHPRGQFTSQSDD